MDIALNFSNDAGRPDDSAVVLFQPNAAGRPDAPVTAWKVIRHCGHGWTHPFIYSTEVELALNDDYGNYSARTLACAGDRFSITGDAVGRRLACTGADQAAQDIAVRNDMPRGALNVCVFRQHRLLAVRTNVAPGQKAQFRFDPLLWIARAPTAIAGAAIDAAALDADRTALPLLGIASADIVMTGGGPGPASTALQFHLKNIAMA